MLKTCTRCGQRQSLDCFSKNKSASDGLSYHCKTCASEYYQANKDKILAQNKEWQVNNPERCRAYQLQHDRKRETGVTGKMRAMLRGSRKRAKEKGILHTLKVKDLQAMFVTHCPITGREIVWEPDLNQILHYNPLGPSLDRTNPSEGYTPSNVRIVSHQGNTWKNNMTLEDAEKVVAYLRSIL
jgi:hypothetical protein